MFSTFGLLTRFQKSCCITKCLQNCSLEFTRCFLCSLHLEQTPSYSAPQSLLFVDNWLKIEIIISSKFASAVTVTGNYFIQKACHVLDVRVVEEQHKEWGVVKNHFLLFFLFAVLCTYLQVTKQSGETTEERSWKWPRSRSLVEIKVAQIGTDSKCT